MRIIIPHEFTQKSYFANIDFEVLEINITSLYWDYSCNIWFT